MVVLSSFEERGFLVNIAKLLIFVGLAFVVLGLLIYFGQKMGFPLGRLPGDLAWKKEGAYVRFPLATCLLLSALFTLLLNLFFWIFRR